MDSMLMQELFGEPTLISNSTFTKAEAVGMWRKANLERFPTLPARSYSTQRLHPSKRQSGGTSTYDIL